MYWMKPTEGLVATEVVAANPRSYSASMMYHYLAIAKKVEQ
jgi:hypothetical protein